MKNNETNRILLDWPNTFINDTLNKWLDDLINTVKLSSTQVAVSIKVYSIFKIKY